MDRRWDPSRTSAAALAGLGLACLYLGCAGSGEDPNCAGAKCDAAGEFQDRLADRADPIAAYLRTTDADELGTLETDYRRVLAGVAETMGCSQDSVMTFALSDDLVQAEPFPRLISVACSDDDSKASDFFIAASFMDAETGDVDLRDVEMFAWDGTERRYRFYAFSPYEPDPSRVQIEIDPKRCEQCHMTPSDVAATGMPMTPLMNEINRPWMHWNAEPGFPSFDYTLPSDMQRKSNFAALMTDQNKGPASRFEEIIRNGGHAKVASARLRQRRNPADLDQTMDMLRPLFCSEQVNYVSEDFDSGVLFSSAVVDPGIRNMFRAIRPDDWPWNWVNGDTMRLPPPAPGQAITQIPVRGNADVTTELQMVSVRALTPYQVLRVRALDWTKPVFSEFRCGLWQNAVSRFRVDPPSLAEATRISDALPIVFEAIMQIDGMPLHPGTDDTVIALDVANEDNLGGLAAALAEGTLDASTCDGTGAGYCTADVDQLGSFIDQMVQTHEADGDRTLLGQERNRRICHLTEPVDAADDRFESAPIRFENRPALPVECSSAE